MITIEKYCQILEMGYSMDAVTLLQFIEGGTDISEERVCPKIGALEQMLIRKGLLVDDKITDSGKELLSMVKGGEMVKKKTVTDYFEKWWWVYPSTNMFQIKGRTFNGTQSKKIKKSECKVLFNKLLAEGYDIDEVISATSYHFEVAKEMSLKTGQNQLSYIANSERYLRERMFEPYIELYKKNVKEEKDSDVKKITNVKDLF